MIRHHIIPLSLKILEYMLDCRRMLHAWIGLISIQYPYSEAISGLVHNIAYIRLPIIEA